MMTSLAAILIPLSLLQAAPSHAHGAAQQPSGYTNHFAPPHKRLYVGGFPRKILLEILGRDVAEDIIQYYNKLTASGQLSPVLSIPDVKDNYVIGKSSYNISATKGSMKSDQLLLLPDPIEVTLADYIYRREHLVSAKIPITILNLELEYKALNVKMNIVDPNQSVDVKKGAPKAKGPAKAKEAANKATAAAKVFVGGNKFLVDTDLVHIINEDDWSTHCYVSVRNITAEEFEVKKVDIENLNEVDKTILDALANEFKNSLLKKSYAAQLIRELVDAALPSIIPPYCTYVLPEQAAKILRSTINPTPHLRRRLA